MVREFVVVDHLNQKHHLKQFDDLTTSSKKRIVGGFGIKDKGHTNALFWVVSGQRDQRHGVVDEPAPKDNYLESLYEEMFSKW